MGKLKKKQPEVHPVEEKANDDIFKTLFGHQTTVPSLFSDQNPFKRQPGNSDPTEPEKPKSSKAPVSEEAVGLSDLSEKKIKKKKRKREEVENEYEAKKYGSVEGAKAKVGEKRKTVDNPAEVLVPKEGFDDESKLLRTVFVGNLPLKVKKKGLIKEFSKFGDVESVRVRSVPITDTKTPRKGAVITKQFHAAADCVHAYVVFKTEESAKAALSNNMAMVEGHHIRVDRACPPRKKMKGDENPGYDHKRTVFVGNLPFDVKDEEVYKLFCGIKDMESNVEGVRIIRDPHSNLGKGIAFVLFKTREAAHAVVKKRNVKLRDRELRLSHAKADSTPSKRKNPLTPSDKSESPPKKFRGSGSAEGSKSKKSFTPSASMSYQGLQASKSGVQKKVAKARNRPERPLSKPTASKGKEGGRNGKRPTVAARKAKSKALREIGVSDGKGMKRKMESRTPDSAHRTKKAKKF